MNFTKSDIFKKWLLILLGSFTWAWTMVKSGLIYSFGMGFWGANGHDGIWHIALSESLAQGSLQMPVFSGNNLQNYHLGFDILIALLHKATAISIPTLYFQIIPPLFAILIGHLTYLFVFQWKKSHSQALMSTFFVYFGGSFGYLIGKGESAFWSQQSISTLINPPFALSIVLLLIAFILLNKKRTLLNTLVSIFLFGVLIEVKAYAGVLALGSLFVSGLFLYVTEKRKDILIIFIFSSLLSGALIFPMLTSSGNLFVWQPMWFLETMMGLSDRIGWDRYFSALSSYKSGGNLIKLIPAYLVAFAIFILGNAGARIVGALLQFMKSIKRISWIDVFILSFISLGTIIPMLFLQNGTPWNTIQFFYYSLFFLSILAGIGLAQMKWQVILFVVVLTLPTTYLTLRDVYMPQRPPAMISNLELSALNFLAEKPEGVVLTYPFDSYKSKEAELNPPRPLYLYTSTAYVSAFSKHQTFLEDQINLDITGFDWNLRRSELEKWYKESDEKVARRFLKSNNIKYIYWLNGQRAYLGEWQLGLKQIFENKQVVIYEVED